jgi:hypothetical protein
MAYASYIDCLLGWLLASWGLPKADMDRTVQTVANLLLQFNWFDQEVFLKLAEPTQFWVEMYLDAVNQRKPPLLVLSALGVAANAAGFALETPTDYLLIMEFELARSGFLASLSKAVKGA